MEDTCIRRALNAPLFAISFNRSQVLEQIGVKINRRPNVAVISYIIPAPQLSATERPPLLPLGHLTALGRLCQ